MNSSYPGSDGGAADRDTPRRGADSSSETGRPFFDWILSTGLSRREEAWIGGVFGALADKLRWDAALVRGLGVVALIVFTAPVLMFYGLTWLLVPDARGRIHAQQALRGSYPAGFWGAAVLTVIGALNVFTPTVVGPFAAVLNLVLIGVVAWAVWVMLRRHRESKAQTSPTEEPGPPRADGRPAWYPTEGPPSAESSRHHTAEHSGPGAPAASETSASRESRTQTNRPATVDHAPGGSTTGPAEDPEKRRRRRLVTFGLLLLAIPAIALTAWSASALGLATTSAVLLGLAGVVIILSLMQLTAALRGRRGRPGLLGTFAVLMMLVFAGSGFGSGVQTPYAFGNYETSSSQVTTAFANTTVDLRDLRQQVAAESGSTVDELKEGFEHTVEVNTAFSNTTVIVPDGVWVEVDNGQALGQLNVRTQDLWRSTGGISGSSLTVEGDSASAERVVLDLNSAFGNVTLYDATTYAEQELDGAEPQIDNGSGADNDTDDDAGQGPVLEEERP